MGKKKDYMTEKSALTGGAIVGTAGAVKGGSIGVALFGGAFGVPLFVPAIGIGIIAGGVVGLGIKAYKNKKNKLTSQAL
ncbi:MAG: hypothetical protein OXJ52_06540 [Oligoflexia bacterium]|nr:hypothetical protein [Oligoflexia bacterium]